MMDWQEVFQNTVMFLLGSATYALYGWLRNRAVKPYRWRCFRRDCEFKLETNNEDIFKELKRNHVLVHLER